MVVDLTSYDPYAAAPPPDQPPAAPPQEASAAPQQPVDLTSYDPYVAPAATQGTVQSPAPSAPTDLKTYDAQATQPAPEAPASGYVPGTNAPLDALFAAGDAIGDKIEQVGGPELRQNLSGFAPPVKEVAEANGIGDKINALTSYWDRPAEHQESKTTEQVVKGTNPQDSYNLLNPSDLGRMAGDFGQQLTDYAQHPEHILGAIPADTTEGTAVFGEQGLQDWVDANPEKVAQFGDDYEGLYREYLNDIGYTWEKGGLVGLGKGIVQESLMDPSLIPSLIATGGASKVAQSAAKAGKVGVAHGIMRATELGMQAVGGPDDLLLEKAPGIVAKTVGKAIPGPVKGLFDTSPKAARQEQGAVVNEVASTIGLGRDQQNLTGVTPASAPPAQAPVTPSPAPTAPGATPATTNTAPMPVRSTVTVPAATGRDWLWNPAHRVWEVDGRLPGDRDLKQASAAMRRIPPNVLEGFDEHELGTRLLTDTRPVAMRAALTQGFVDPHTRAKTPYWADDVPFMRMTGDPNITPEQRAAGARFHHAMVDRINTFGEDEVRYQLRKLQQNKYRGQRGGTVEHQIWWDNQRRAIRDAIEKSTYDGPVNFGVAHRKRNGAWVPDRVIQANVNGAGPVINIADFEPDMATWHALQSSATAQGNNPALRVTTPPPAPGTATPPMTLPTGATGAPAATGTVVGAGGAATPPAPTGPVGPRLKFDGLLLPQGMDTTAEMQWGGKSLYEHMAQTQDELHEMLDIMEGVISDPTNKLPALVTKYSAAWKKLYGTDADFANITRQDATLFAANVTTTKWADSLPKLATRDKGLFGRVLKTSRDIGDFRSAVGLYNYAAAPRQTVMQYSGNLMTALLTKPQAVTRLLDPRTSRMIYKQAKEMRLANSPNARAKTAFGRSMERMGRAPNTMISDPGKGIISMGQSEGMSPALKALRKLVAPDWLRDFVSIPDGMWRDAIAAAHHQPLLRDMQKKFPGEVQGITSEMVRKSGGSLSVPAQQVARVVKETIDLHYSREMRYSEVRAVDIADAIKAKFASAPNQDEITKLANHIGRAYATRDNTIYQLTAQEVKRLGFSWAATNLDELARHIFLYHYWSSRAGGLYFKELMKNPWMMANFTRLAQGLAEEADEMDYPAWMTGFSRLLSSPGGNVLLASPLNLFATMITFADWQYGMAPDKLSEDLTMLGRARGILPALINPLWDSLAWGLGFYGGENAQPTFNPTGFEQIPRIAIQLLNAANVNGHLPEGMLRDANGDPVILPETPITGLVAKFSSAVTGAVRENPQPVPDLFSGYRTKTNAFLYDQLITDHPEWTEDQVTREFNAILQSVDAGNPAPDEYLAAERMAVANSLQGPEIAQVPEPFRGLIGGVIRNLSPVQILNRPEMIMAARSQPISALGRESQPLPEFKDSYDSMDMAGAIYDTPRMTALNIANEDAYGDPKLSAARGRYYGILNAENPDGEVVGGVHYSQAQIMGMTDARRFKLAREALSADGFTTADLEAQNQLSDELMAANPDLAEYRGFVDAMNNDPRGREAFVDELYRTEPAFARMMDKSPYPKGSPEWYEKAADWPETFLGSTGAKTSQYDPQELPDAGMDTGQYGAATLDEIKTRQEEQSGSYSGKIEQQLNELYYAQKLLDQAYPGYGFKVGSGKLPYEVWTTMKGVWEDYGIDTKYITSADNYAVQYAAWKRDNPSLPDTSVQAWLDATMTDDGSNKFADQLASGESPASTTIDISKPPPQEDLAAMFGFATGSTPTSTRLVRNDREAQLRASPNGSPVARLPKNVPLRVVKVEGDWAYVQAPAGFEGYIPVSFLLLG